MKKGKNAQNGVKSTETTFDIVETIYEFDGVTLSELAEHHSLAKSTVHSHLSTLMNRRYVIEIDGKYHVGLLFLSLGVEARQNNVPSEFIQPTIRRMAEEIGEKVQFVVEEYGRAFSLFTERGTYAIRTGRQEGTPMPLHDNAAGKAILAELPKGRVSEIIDRWGLPASTSNTITDPETLYRELESIRNTSIAYNRGESREELRAVGSAITKHGNAMGAISVAGPKHRIFGEKQNQIEEVVLGLVDEIELNLD